MNTTRCRKCEREIPYQSHEAGQLVVCASCNTKQQLPVPGAPPPKLQQFEQVIDAQPVYANAPITSRPAVARPRPRSRGGQPWALLIIAILGLNGIVAVIAVALISWAFKPIEKDLDEAEQSINELVEETKEVTVTRVHFQRVTKGMSYRQVVRIIGEPGSEVFSMDDGDHSTQSFVWRNGNGSAMSAVFQNDRLVAKTQFALP